MSDIIEPVTGFNRPRPTEDAYVARLYDEFGVGEVPSLEDLEPFAIELMKGKKILEGMSLVLGRRVDAREAIADPDLGGILRLALSNPEDAFGVLLLKLSIEETQS